MKLSVLLVMLGCVLAVGCKSTNKENDQKIRYTNDSISSPSSLVFHLSNDEVKWTVGDEGLCPELTGIPSKKLLKCGRSENELILRAMKDENKFVAAHVLLTKINLDDYYPLNDKVWNRLKVIRKGESVEYDSAQISDLVKFWKKALAMKEAARRKKAMGE